MGARGEMENVEGIVLDGGVDLFTEDIFSRQFVRVPKEACFRAFLVFLLGAEIVDEGVKLIPVVLQAQRLLIGDAEVLGGVVDDAAGYVLVGDAVDVDLAVYSIEIRLLGIIREMSGWDFEMEELVVPILIFVKLCFELTGGVVLQVFVQSAVADPVEEDETPESYGS